MQRQFSNLVTLSSMHKSKSVYLTRMININLDCKFEKARNKIWKKAEEYGFTNFQVVLLVSIDK